MSIIKILPENLVNQIAAGEVVERPASVVKELVENSLDAGSTSITIEVKNSGKSLIKITDNGYGMDKDDLILAIARHATSKIGQESDLWNIKTMGFRGEALASISSVSKLTIRSKTKMSMSGYEINCDGGNMINMKDCGMSYGTQIFVHDLFFNTPAREKYLKQESTELFHITSTLNTIALANPDVAFKFMHNDKIVFDYPRATDLISRVSDVFGKSTAHAMVPVFYGGSDFEINGFIGKPVISRTTSQHQYFFVNKRPITHNVLAYTIKQAYHSLLMENKKPVFVINIKIDPALIDVNVHPRKIEIRFQDQQNIVKTMYSATKAALEKSNLMPLAYTETTRYMSDSFPKDKIENAPLFHNQDYGHPTSRPQTIKDAMEFSRNFMDMRDFNPIKTEDIDQADSIKAISQVSDSYIVAKDKRGLILIDQHAAHERVRYEELMDQFENEKKNIQPLLMPIQLELSPEEFQIIEEDGEIFKNLGFGIEPFGGKTVIVNEVPSFLVKEELEEIINGVIDDIINQQKASKIQGKTEAIINYMACRSAVKFGQKLSLEEMQVLINKLEKLKRPYTCPHGRPTMISLSTGELEKMFGRK